jgi:hypothetical protein
MRREREGVQPARYSSEAEATFDGSLKHDLAG